MSTFSKTSTINAYANANSITGMELIKNPKTDKIFGKDSNGVTYRVSEKIKSAKDLKTASISWFTPEDGGEASWMIHPTGENNNVVAQLSFGAPANKSIATF